MFFARKIIRSDRPVEDKSNNNLKSGIPKNAHLF